MPLVEVDQTNFSQDSILHLKTTCGSGLHPGSESPILLQNVLLFVRN